MKIVYYRLLGLMLCFIMIFIQIPVFAMPSQYKMPADIEGTQYEEALFVLSSLNILKGYEDGSFKPLDNISRAEFVAVIIKMLGITDETMKNNNAATGFVDVPAAHWASGYINAAVSLGLISGDGDGAFKPDDPVTYEQALKLLVNVIGYETLAKERGGYPSGFVIVAQEKGITKNVSFKQSAFATRGDVARLAYNTMKVDIMRQTKEGTYTVENGTTLLTERMEQYNCYWMSGQVTAIPKVGLSGNNMLKDDELEIDNIVYNSVYRIDERDANELLGYHVEFFAEEKDGDSKRTIISMREKKDDNTKLFISQDQITSSDKEKITYSTDKNENDEKEAYLSKNAKIIYNNRALKEYDDHFLSTLSGDITLLGDGDSNKYDIVYINVYESFLIDRVNIEDKIIYLKDKLLNGKAFIKIDEKEEENTHVIYDTEGKEISVADLKEGDAISVAASRDGQYISINVVQKQLTGVVDEYNEADGTIIVDGKEYRIAQKSDGTFELTQTDIKIGQTGSFYLDINGRIFSVADENQQTEGYAYVIQLQTLSGVDKICEMKLLKGASYTEVEDEDAQEDDTHKFQREFVNQGIYILKCEQDVKLNGVKVKSEELPARLPIGSVIIYKSNEKGNINSIDIAIAYGERGNRNYDYDTDTFGGISKGAFFIDTNTVIFNVPNSGNEDDYYAKKVLKYNTGEEYDAQAYDFPIDTKIAKAMVIHSDLYYDSYDQITDDTPITIVDKVSQVLNSDGDPIYKLRGYRKGVLVEKECRDWTNLNSIVRSVKQGDVIRYAEDGAGRIADIKKIEELNAVHMETFYSDNKIDKPNGVWADERILGKAYSTELYTLKEKSTSAVNLISVSIAGDSTNNVEYILPVNSSKPAVYMYDKQKNKVTLSSLDSIQSIQNLDEADASTVYMWSNYGSVKVVVIIKG